MSVQWRTRTRTAFRFWEQVLKSWDEYPECAGQYANLITHLKRFETRTTDTFKHVITRGADPVYWFTEWKRFLQHHPIPFNPRQN